MNLLHATPTFSFSDVAHDLIERLIQASGIRESLCDCQAYERRLDHYLDGEGNHLRHLPRRALRRNAIWLDSGGS